MNSRTSQPLHYTAPRVPYACDNCGKQPNEHIGNTYECPVQPDCAQPERQGAPFCAGTNCTASPENGFDHSAECVAQHYQATSSPPPTDDMVAGLRKVRQYIAQGHYEYGGRGDEQLSAIDRAIAALGEKGAK